MGTGTNSLSTIRLSGLFCSKGADDETNGVWASGCLDRTYGQ